MILKSIWQALMSEIDVSRNNNSKFLDFKTIYIYICVCVCVWYNGRGISFYAFEFS